MKSLILYRSEYGSTKQYAEWIQEALSAEADRFDHLKNYDLQDYDLLIVGEGVYAGGFKVAKPLAQVIKKHPDKRVIFFIVGIADMEDRGNRDKLYKDLSTALGSAIEKIKVFYLRGALDYSRMSFKHKSMMWMLVKYLKRLPEEKLPKDGDQLIATYGKRVDFIDKNAIEPLITYVKEALGQ